MPKYSYKCPRCEHELEVEVSLTSSSIHGAPLCPMCAPKVAPMARVYLPPAVSVKGGTGAARHSFKRNNNE